MLLVYIDLMASISLQFYKFDLITRLLTHSQYYSNNSRALQLNIVNSFRSLLRKLIDLLLFVLNDHYPTFNLKNTFKHPTIVLMCLLTSFGSNSTTCLNEFNAINFILWSLF
jgi:hypothetical protein